MFFVLLSLSTVTSYARAEGVNAFFFVLWGLP